MFISHRIRARRTFELFFAETFRKELEGKSKIIENIREWEYGDYEGLLTTEIRAGRIDRGLIKERQWDIWRDGCEGGESPAEVTARLDLVIDKIKKIQGAYIHGEKGVDIVLIAHGHILRAFAKRWIGFDLEVRVPHDARTWSRWSFEL